MQLYILDKNPVKAAQLIPDKYKFKMLIELGQLICSNGISTAYKPIKQGKELQDWIENNCLWTLQYMNTLVYWAESHIKMLPTTYNKIIWIRNDLYNNIFNGDTDIITHAYFRYNSDYKCDIPSKTLLPIDDCIREYKKYINWKIKEKS